MRYFRTLLIAGILLSSCTGTSNSYWAVKHLGDAGIEAMKKRGRIQEGLVADITIFDPENITENAGYQVGTNGLPSTGIPYVLVNGTIMVNDSKVVDGKFPGQAIRYLTEESGKFIPLEKESYLERIFTPKVPQDAVDHGVE